MLSACQLLLRQDAATKRARAISLSEGSADLELVLFVGSDAHSGTPDADDFMGLDRSKETASVRV